MSRPPPLQPVPEPATDRIAAAVAAIVLGVGSATCEKAGYPLLMLVCATLGVTLALVALALWLVPLVATRLDRRRVAAGSLQPPGKRRRWIRRRAPLHRAGVVADQPA